MAAPITATVTSSGSWVAASAAAASTASGPASRRAQLYQGRDLAASTDYRTVLAAILERHLRLDDRQLVQVFPDLPPTWSNF